MEVEEWLGGEIVKEKGKMMVPVEEGHHVLLMGGEEIWRLQLPG